MDDIRFCNWVCIFLSFVMAFSAFSGADPILIALLALIQSVHGCTGFIIKAIRSD